MAIGQTFLMFAQRFPVCTPIHQRRAGRAGERPPKQRTGQGVLLQSNCMVYATAWQQLLTEGKSQCKRHTIRVPYTRHTTASPSPCCPVAAPSQCLAFGASTCGMQMVLRQHCTESILCLHNATVPACPARPA
jgi:hypothetical protein